MKANIPLDVRKSVLMWLPEMLNGFNKNNNNNNKNNNNNNNNNNNGDAQDSNVVSVLQSNVTTISNLAIDNYRHLQYLSSNMYKVKDKCTKDVHNVHDKLQRYHTLDKLLRFPWPNIGGSNTTRYHIWGYVEINHRGLWGSICNSNGQFTDADANVVCRHAGYSSGVFDDNKYRQPFVEEAKKVWLDDTMRCYGSEMSVDQCPGSKWSPNIGCYHHFYVGVKCYF